MTWEIGQNIGAYELRELVGSGGMATVYKAYHAKLDRFVAIKAMHPNFAREEAFLARFNREARIVARLEHVNIVPVYDFNEHEGQPYLVMKFIEGDTLKIRLRQDEVDPEIVIEIMGKIAKSLTYAHQEGVLHRDIKPSNIMIDQRGEPFLTDFGLARIAQSGESTMSADMMLGTPHYISPEQATGSTELDARTDVYSLGIILYELVVGRVPFLGASSYSIVHDQIYSPLPSPLEFNPNVPAEVEAVLSKALAKSPQDRYNTPTEMIEAYTKAVRGESVVVPRRETPQTDSNIPKVTSNDANRNKHVVRVPATPSPPSPPPHIKSKITEADNPVDKIAIGVAEFGRHLGDTGRDLGQKIESKVREWEESWDDEDGEKDWKSRFRKFISDESERVSPEEKMRKRIEERIKKRQEELQGVLIHLFFFVAINWWLFGFGDWLGQVAQGNINFPHLVTFFWGIGMISHIGSYWFEHGPGRARRERQIERELQREMKRQSSVKAKHEDLPYDNNDRHIRLTGDGEFTDSFIDEIDKPNKRKNR